MKTTNKPKTLFASIIITSTVMFMSSHLAASSWSYDDKGSKGSKDSKGSKGSSDKGSKGSKDKKSKKSYQKGSKDSYSDNYTSEVVITLPSSYTADAGRLLGSQCAQCHGTNGVSVNKWDSIAGEDNLDKEMFAHKAPIMMSQARGYTPEEISLMEDWFQTLSKYKD